MPTALVHLRLQTAEQPYSAGAPQKIRSASRKLWRLIRLTLDICVLSCAAIETAVPQLLANFIFVSAATANTVPLSNAISGPSRKHDSASAQCQPCVVNQHTEHNILLVSLLMPTTHMRWLTHTDRDRPGCAVVDHLRFSALSSCAMYSTHLAAVLFVRPRLSPITPLVNCASTPSVLGP